MPLILFQMDIRFILEKCWAKLESISRHYDVEEIIAALFSEYTESGRLFKYKLEIERD